MSSYGRGDDGSYDDLPRVDVVVPDDPRELDTESRAVRRDLRWERRRVRLRRLFAARRWRRLVVSAPLVIALLIVLGLMASTLGVLRPRPAERPGALPLAEHLRAAPGAVGALLPPGEVVVDGKRQSARDLRPAVLALIPPDCGCERQLDALFAQVHQYGLDLYLVGRLDSGDQVEELTSEVGNGTAIPVFDKNVLVQAYPAAGLTAVLVHADGIVRAVHPDLPVGFQLEPELSLLAMPGAR